MKKAQLKLCPHAMLAGENVVEVRWGDQLLCTVAGGDGASVRIISKHITDGFPAYFSPVCGGLPGVVELRFDLSASAPDDRAAN